MAVRVIRRKTSASTPRLLDERPVKLQPADESTRPIRGIANSIALGIVLWTVLVGSWMLFG